MNSCITTVLVLSTAAYDTHHVYVAAINAEERAFQERLENAVLDVLTSGSIPTEDLCHWSLRSFAFKNIDAHISRACDDEQPHLERLFLLLMIYKCLNRLLEPEKAPVKRQLSPTEQLYREQQRHTVKGKRKYSVEYKRRLAKMNADQLKEFRAREAKRIREARARKRQ
jgi:hypothetical protein